MSADIDDTSHEPERISARIDAMGGQMGGQKDESPRATAKQGHRQTITPPTSRLFNVRKKDVIRGISFMPLTMHPADKDSRQHSMAEG
ncbi:hypothetical protein [Pseudomonas fluorescens]|uniref:hypothetical protein n=1 Tax=Pseudomonas fluorescens TaxID=294 RepID=UPI00123FC5F4|nr:hypothetical protein [Pseudomonas fluorescens]